MSRTQTKHSLTGPHLFLKEAVGMPWSTHVEGRSGPGECSPQQTSQLCRAVHCHPNQKTSAVSSLSFHLNQWLFFRGRGPKLVLRPSHDKPVSWHFSSENR